MEGVVFFQSELIINPVTRRDVGAFTCSIDNITLTATLFVELCEFYIRDLGRMCVGSGRGVKTDTPWFNLIEVCIDITLVR